MARASSQRKQIETPSPTFPWGTHESCPSLRNSCSIKAASPSSSQHQRSLPSSIHFFVISKPRPSTYQRTDSSMFDTPKNGTACLTLVLVWGWRFMAWGSSPRPTTRTRPLLSLEPLGENRGLLLFALAKTTLGGVLP